jgi:type IV pilus assembly protein PilO
MAAAGGSTLDRLGTGGKIILSLVLVGLVAAVYFVVFYGDLATSIDQANAAQKQLNTQLAAAMDAKADYQKDFDEKTRKEQLAAQQKKVLPDEAEMPSFLASIQNVATASGISLTSYTPQDEEPGQYYAKVPMALTLSGRFHQVARFFYGVGQLDRIINVEDIDMVVKKSTENSEEVIVEVKCLATAFRALKPGETAAGTTGRRRK